MTRILLTNDDGIHSEGLQILERTLREVGDVYVIAPAAEMSGASHSLTLARPLRIRQIDDRHWTVDGTPTDCVTLALHKILPEEERPDLCVSGINHGGNLGDDATYSGTVAGALEATILGVPGIAFSLVARENFDFSESARFAVTALRKVLAEGLPEGTDYKAIELGYISVTPLKSDMTDHRALTAIETWNYIKGAELLYKG